MDKRIVYPGAIPLDSDLLIPQRNTEIALGHIMAAVFGTNTIVDGLAVSATAPASMQLVVGQGRIIFSTTVDTINTGFGTLPVDNVTPLVKVGGLLSPVTLPAFAAPTTNGQTQNYLIEAAFSEVDGTPVSIPYYNALNPSQPTAQTQNTVRQNLVALQVKAGTPGTSGSQVTPAPDSGYVGLWVVSVAYGATTLGPSNVTAYQGSPFVPAKLGPGMVPGFANTAYYTATGTSNFIVPAGVTRIFSQIWAPGGGGGAVQGAANLSGNAGGGGGYSEKLLTGLSGGTVIPITIGAPGIGGLSGAAGSAGGTCSVGSYHSATGGNPGGNAAGSGSGTIGTGGNGVGGDLNIHGQSGGTFWLSGTTNVVSAGAGGTWGTPLGQSGLGSSNGGNGLFPGGGGSPGITETSTTQSGGAGGGGLIILRW